MALETIIEYTDRNKMSVYTNEKKIINRIMKFKEENPDEITIYVKPEDNEGFIIAYMPASYLSLRPKRKVEMSEEEKDKLRERFEKVRNKHQT